MKTLMTTLVLLSFLTLSGQEIVHIKMKSTSKPIIQAKINGKKGYFLVDTGADISVINTAELKRYDLEETKIYGENRRAMGFNGNHSSVLKVKNVNFILGEKFDHDDFYSIDLEEIVKSIEAKTHLKITGIIGADLLLKYHCVIDYNQRHVTFVDGKMSKRFATR